MYLPIIFLKFNPEFKKKTNKTQNEKADTVPAILFQEKQEKYTLQCNKNWFSIFSILFGKK